MAYGVNAPFGLRPFSSISGGAWTEKTNQYQILASADGLVTYARAIFTGDLVVWGTSISGAAPTGGAGTIAVYNPNYADGAPATFAGVGAATAIGVFLGCEYTLPTGVVVKSPYWPGATTAVLAGSTIKANVIDDPDVVYDVQVSTNIDAAGNAFVGSPLFPNTNATGAGAFNRFGSFGRNFAFMSGGGTNFTTVANPRGGFYTNNPLTGDPRTGQSGFYLCVDTSTVAANDHDYLKNTTTLPLRALGYSPNVQNIAAPGLTMGTTPFLNVLVTLNNPVYAVGSAPTVYIA